MLYINYISIELKIFNFFFWKRKGGETINKFIILKRKKQLTELMIIVMSIKVLNLDLKTINNLMQTTSIMRS